MPDNVARDQSARDQFTRDQFAIDQFGYAYGWRRGTGDWNQVALAFAHRHPIQVLQEAGTLAWQQHLPIDHSLQWGWEVGGRARLWISPIQRRFASEGGIPKAQWHPPVLWLGIGYQRGTSSAAIEFAVAAVCRAYHLAEASLVGLATIDRKASDPILPVLCADRQWNLQLFSADHLRQVAVPHPSPVVADAIATPSVAEAAALLAARAAGATENQAEANEMLPLSGDRRIAMAYLRVTKQRVPIPASLHSTTSAQPSDRRPSITIAIAQSSSPYLY